ncbi:MAG: hypothetical protein Ct9H300mP1_25090 [Planctomycetaceae bacterium]|nr:MAG: hypothetical protein Ct9H300mP1_25090 [Planctomycetaceae bacterium]
MAEAVSESPNRVLLLAGVFEVRGSTATTLRLAERLPEQGFEPLVVCSDAGGFRRRFAGNCRFGSTTDSRND